MLGEPQEPKEWIIFQVARLWSWAKEEERKLPRYLDAGQYGNIPVDTPRQYKERTDATQDGVAKFQESLSLFQTIQAPQTMIAYLKTVYEHFKNRDRTNASGIAQPGDTSSEIYHKAHRNMEFIFSEFERYF